MRSKARLYSPAVHTFEELASAWRDGRKPPKDVGTVKGLCVRLGQGQHGAPAKGRLFVDSGMEGDRWLAADDPDRRMQLTLIMARVSDLIGHALRPGFHSGDNCIVDLDLSDANTPAGARIRLGDAVVEITEEPHTGCKHFSARFGPGALKFVNFKDFRGQNLRGVNARVLEPGIVRLGDEARLIHT